MSSITANFPADRSSLGIISHNNVFDGDDFRDDGYVYRNNKKVRKWFSSMGDWEHFWHPVLNDIPRLESLYHRLMERNHRHWDVLWKHVEKIVSTVSPKQRYNETVYIVHAQPYRTCNQAPGKCWVYYIHNLKGHPGKYSFGFDWVDIPEKFEHLEFGNMLYHLYVNASGAFRNKVYEVFKRACEQHLFSFGRGEKHKVFNEFLVNGRKYIFHTQRSKYDLTYDVYTADDIQAFQF